MNTCYNCQTSLTELNSSDEHILLNGIGGRLKSKNLLCQTCNSNFGSDCDAELVKQLLFLTSHLQVKKHRGDISVIKGGKTADGEAYDIIDGSKPVMAKPIYNVTKDENKVIFNIHARDQKEMRTILKGIARKYPTFDFEKAIANTQHTTKYLDTPLHFQQVIGGNLAFRSIVKTAVNFYLYCNGQRDNIAHLLPYINGVLNVQVVCLFNPNPTPYEEIQDEVLHLMHLVGNPKERILYCYIHFFSTYSFIVLLSDTYNGIDFHTSYAYDVLQNIEVTKSIQLNISKNEITNLLIKNGWQESSEMVVKKMNRVMGLASKRHSEAAINDITSKAVDKIFVHKYGHEPVVTEQMIEDLAAEVTKKFVRFLYRSGTIK